MDADELAALTEKLAIATKSMRDEAKQRQAELAASAKTVARECEKMREEAEAECEEMRNNGEKEITATLRAAYEEVTSMKQKHQDERNDWEDEKRSRGVGGEPFQDDTVTFSVGGTNYSMYASSLRKRQNAKTLLALLLSGRHEVEGGSTSNPIFIDRDPHLFRYIMQYLRNPDQFRLPKDESEIEQLVVEAVAYIMPPAFFGKLVGESIEKFIKFGVDSIEIPKPTKSWNQHLALTLFDDDEAPTIIHFDGKNDGIIQFNVDENFVRLQIRNGSGMKFDIEAMEKGKWQKVAEYKLKKSGWNDPVGWEPRRAHPAAWRLVLKKNTEKNWLQNFRWWKMREQTTWEPHSWAKKNLSEAEVARLRGNALYDFHHG